MKLKLDRLSIVNYKEEEFYVSHCLEMDLKGRGTSLARALDELFDLIRIQISFAIYKKEIDLLHYPAEKLFISKEK